ncbi:MAG: DUF6142 family protein [Butyribacter sp.]|nr:DUF6142 family protein [bacterium]MDY3855172.1 DUF6142 family protein [Butyribacter sp.]
MSSKKRGTQSSLRLTDKKHPVSGVIATILGVVSVISFIVICFVSSQSHGNAGILIGLAGIICFLLSIAAFVLSWITLHQENIRPLFPTIGAVIGGLSIVFYLLLYIWGTFI